MPRQIPPRPRKVPTHPLRRFAPFLLAIIAASSSPAPASDTRELITWLLADGRDLRGIPFAEVLEATTGKKIIPIDPATDQSWLAPLGAALDATLTTLNDPSHPIHSAARINEASRFIEDELHTRLNAIPGWQCTIPVTADGTSQRSGYPDLRLALPDGTIIYLDPKLLAADSRSSTLRTFYYEPKTLTNKVHDHARHLLIGISHNGKSGPDLQLLAWELVDISRIRVQLKAEFQASNKDLYQSEAIITTSTPENP